MTLPLFPPPRPDEAPHVCHARGCGEPVPPQFLMCGPHWRRVAGRIKQAVWRSYRPGQCTDKNPSEAWHRAADAAIGYVATLERKPVRPCEQEALKAFGCEWNEGIRMFCLVDYQESGK